MQSLLYLVHRIPYPPNKGDKIRSFNLLRVLSKKYKIYLGAFIDDAYDWRYLDEVKKYCEGILIRPLSENTAKLRSLSGFLTGSSLSIPYYKDKKMQTWVDNIVLSKGIGKIMVFSSTMAQYVEDKKYHECVRIVDFVDVDSDKWKQYSLHKKFPINWIYAREANKLAEYEFKICSMFYKTLFVSKNEMQHFVDLHPLQEFRVNYYCNGVDSDYFNPSQSYSNPYPENIIPIVFTGAMDYWANEEAVSWFVNTSLQGIRKAYPEVKFYIVGSNPTESVKNLETHEGVVVTGMVDDIRPYIRFARIIVAPIRIARGVQNKVLEAMSMARPIVASTIALEGIELNNNYQPFVADTEVEFVEQCIEIINDMAYDVLQNSARECVLKYYNWDQNLKQVLNYFDNSNVS